MNETLTIALLNQWEFTNTLQFQTSYQLEIIKLLFYFIVLLLFQLDSKDLSLLSRLV